MALGIGRTENEQLANQVWILGEHSEKLLDEATFENYILMGQFTGKKYPNKSGILYISLEKLSAIDSSAGELSRFLLGIDLDPRSEEVKNVASEIRKAFKIMQHDKEARNKMSNLDWVRQDAMEEGDMNRAISVAKKMLFKNKPSHELKYNSGLVCFLT